MILGMHFLHPCAVLGSILRLPGAMGRAGVFHGSSGIGFVSGGETRRAHGLGSRKVSLQSLEKNFGGVLSVKNLPGAITASPRPVQLLRTLLSSHLWLCSQRISAPSTLVSGKLQMKCRNKKAFGLPSWIGSLDVA